MDALPTRRQEDIALAEGALSVHVRSDPGVVSSGVRRCRGGARENGPA